MPADPGRRNQQSWRATLDAAFALLEEAGYDGITMGAIAERAGVGRQTIYRWWPSKGAVVFEAFLDKVNAGPFPAAGKGGFPAQLKRYARGFVSLYVHTTAGRHLRELIGAAQRDPELAEALKRQWFEPRRAPVREALRAAREAGEIRSDVDPEVALDLVFAPLHYRLLVSREPIDNRFADTVVDLAVRALRP